MSMYKPNEFADMLDVSVKTLQRWDREGTLIAFRNPKNRRYYTHKQYLDYVNEAREQDRKCVIYTRVSTIKQKDDLKNQVEFLRQYANAKGLIVDDVWEDIGSGLNYKRKKWNTLLYECMQGNVRTVIISHKDRFIRFGYEWFEELLKSNGVEMIVVNNEKTSPEQELVDDLISIIHEFSCRIYGLRKYKGKIKKDGEVCSELTKQN